MKDKILKYIKSGKKKPSKIEDSKKPKKSDIITKPLIEPSTHRVIICILLSAVIAILISPRLKIPELAYIPGDISKHNIRAPEDFSVEETAMVLDVPAGTVKSRIHHAKRALRRVLKENSS